MNKRRWISDYYFYYKDGEVKRRDSADDSTCKHIHSHDDDDNNNNIKIILLYISSLYVKNSFFFYTAYSLWWLSITALFHQSVYERLFWYEINRQRYSTTNNPNSHSTARTFFFSFCFSLFSKAQKQLQKAIKLNTYFPHEHYILVFVHMYMPLQCGVMVREYDLGL